MHARRRGVVAITVGLAAAGFLVAWFTGYTSRVPSLARTQCTHRGGTRTATRLLAACDPRLRRDVPSPRATAVHRISSRGDPRRRYSRFGRSARCDAIRDSVRLYRGCGSPTPRLTGRGTWDGTRASSVGTVSAREESGFTLIELLIVLVIIGIRAGDRSAVVPRLQGSLPTRRRRRRTSAPLPALEAYLHTVTCEHCISRRAPKP